ncbi:transposase [Bradyrhizobium sp. 173]|nr:transposase [Bradyrhizobium sp. 173]
MDRHVRIDLARLDLHQSPSLRSWRKRGAFNNAIGRSRGGQTTKIHALTDDVGRPLAFLITPGNTHDLVGARDLIGIIRNPRRLLADRAYDARAYATNWPHAVSRP